MVMEERDLALVNKDGRYMYLLSAKRSCPLLETQLMVAMHNQELVHLLNKWQTEEHLTVLTFLFFHLGRNINMFWLQEHYPQVNFIRNICTYHILDI